MTEQAEQARTARARRPRVDLTGHRFARLVVVEYATAVVGVEGRWRCRCDCGKGDVLVDTWSLCHAHTRSCGCLDRESRVRVGRNNATHGATRGGRKMLEYYIWWTMIQRCENPKVYKYSRYGGRGIRVCKRWRESFAAFIEDMGRRPSVGHSIDRKDNNGNYEPGNCRWATRKEQHRNTSRNRMITIGSETRCVAEWCDSLGLDPGPVYRRLRSGWSAERALWIVGAVDHGRVIPTATDR